MKYTQIKPLTKKDLVNTKWDIDEHQRDFFIQYILDSGIEIEKYVGDQRCCLYITIADNSAFLGYGMGACSEFQHSFKTLMNFEDYFEEDKVLSFKEDLKKNGLMGKQIPMGDDREVIKDNGVYYDPDLVNAARNTNPVPYEPEYKGTLMWAYEMAKTGKTMTWKRKFHKEYLKLKSLAKCNEKGRFEWVDENGQFNGIVSINNNTLTNWEIYEDPSNNKIINKIDRVIEKLDDLKKDSKYISFKKLQEILNE